ncbi:DUF885 domain-containing protein [Pseudoalteromonas denitrificans]|uniref:Uncharacterized conserved protein, DUF885 familyt n=1 Tax=Pseudoalteromonas denitrificans DSM 6059 TaxID=1123010 RepID=A0A1I1E6S9_9GAMM|nr:DUF885 domain-containing protein [Pseudoalteromonas denitrificans]SFB82362.1 Uncharacterized conserved protein, DUF885 familyt [Pseudoalteromonas denitrificans DSM 6059]
MPKISLKKSLITLAIATTLVACDNKPFGENEPAKTQSTTESHKHVTRAELDKTINTYTQNFMTLQPALATSLKLSTSIAGSYKNKWPDYSPKGMLALQNSMQNSLNALTAYDLKTLNDADQLHLKVNQVIAKYYLGDQKFKAGYIDTWGGHLPYIVNQIAGPLIDIPKLLQDQHNIENKQDVEDYLTRLNGLVDLIAAVKSKVLTDASNGIILPKALFPNTLGYLNNYVAMPSTEHSLVTSLINKMRPLKSLSDEQKQTYANTAINLVTEKLYPAFSDIKETMISLEAKAPPEDGIWAQPNGSEFYKHEILYLADSNLSPDKIHEIGLAEVNRISKEMDQILKSQGMNAGTIGERMVKLGEMPEFIYEDSDEGRTKLLADLNTEIDKIMLEAPSLFNTIPKYEVLVKRIPVVSQDGAAGGFYMPPALDGSRPGEFAINLKDMKAQPRFSLKTLTYHEAVPGHHFQISLNMEQTDIGIMRQNGQFNAYVEGWALYSEQVASEMGMYKDDPWGNLGRLQAEVYRAARLVVDTGLHHKRWTRKQAIEYFHNATGTAMSDVEGAIDRYMAWPGQALGYKLGMLKILELREWSKKQLGKKFDIKVFHDLVLLPGARPLTILEADVKRWVAKTK